VEDSSGVSRADFAELRTEFSRFMMLYQFGISELMTKVNILKDEFTQPYWAELQEFVAEEREKYTVYPPKDEVYTAFRLAPFDDVRVFLLGQDPYPGPNQAHGLCFSVKPGVPNIYGVVGGDANAIAPGKRPLSTMTPTIVTQGGRAAVVIGSEGGPSIATQIFQVLTAWHDFHMSLASAVAAARVHHQLLPADTLMEEPYAMLEPTVRTALVARGYQFVNRGWNGDVQAIVRAGPQEVAVSDPRGRGVARVLSAPK